MKLRLLTTILLALSAAGCATGSNPQDPYEKLNRATFKFNMGVDKAVTRPLAKAYDKVLPNFVKARVTHFFTNLDSLPTTGNDLLQGQVYYTFADASRFIVNSTLGIGGLFDVASHLDLPPHHNDFGLTLAAWGMKDSPYLVVPLWGPSTVRDSFAEPPNIYMGIWPYIQPWWISASAWGIQFIDRRAQLLPADKLVDQAYDPYVFVRDAYLQSRNAEINSNQTEAGAPASGSSDTGDTFVSADNEKPTPAQNGKQADIAVPTFSTKPALKVSIPQTSPSLPNKTKEVPENEAPKK